MTTPVPNLDARNVRHECATLSKDLDEMERLYGEAKHRKDPDLYCRFNSLWASVEDQRNKLQDDKPKYPVTEYDRIDAAVDKANYFLETLTRFPVSPVGDPDPVEDLANQMRAASTSGDTNRGVPPPADHPAGLPPSSWAVGVVGSAGERERHHENTAAGTAGWGPSR